MQYKAVLFDMDGVLIESEELMVKAGTLALKDFGIAAKPEDFVPFVGRGEDKYIGGVANKYGVEYNPAMKQRCYDYFGEYVLEDAHVPEDLLLILETLKKNGYKMAVCTSSDWNKVIHNLRAIGTNREFFNAMVTGDMIVNKKPDPEIYLKGAELVSCKPEECIVVEDAPSGIKAAHAGGMKAIGITTSFSAEHLKEEAKADIIIKDMHELLDILIG